MITPENLNLRKTDAVKSAVEVIVSAVLELPEEFGDSLNRKHGAIRFVLLEYRLMPDFVWFGMRVLHMVFAFHCFARFGRLPRWISSSQAKRLLEAWRTSRIGTCRNFVRFHESLAIYAWYAEARDLG